MKTFIHALLHVAIAGVACAATPNFIVIMGEAQGWASMSAALDNRNPEGSRNPDARTPNLDALAAAGIRFSDFYAASPRCTPTRAAFFTGRSPAALHITFVNEGKGTGGISPGDRVIAPNGLTELPTTIPTIATLLKARGYTTAHYGKWHCGRINPREYGFDENDGPNNNGGPDEVESPNPKQCYAIADLAVAFLERQRKAGAPFYLHLSEYPSRGPETARPDTVEEVKRRLGTRMDFNRVGVAAGIEEVDKSLGLVFAKARELGLLDNTYIIYTADHGAQGPRANGLLRNGKGTVWEGGLRVPLIVAGPGVAPNQFCHERASTVDLFPTVAALAGASANALPTDLEGGSLVAILTGKSGDPPKRPREELVIHFPHYDKDELGPASVILLRNYKLIHAYERPQPLLFAIDVDPGETRDLAAAQPAIVQALNQRLAAYLNAVHAELPIPNPGFDPGGQRSVDRRGMKGRGRRPD